ncbi:MAG TPA: hypothetical protein VHM24_06130, partial [Gemmatimonadaceae bacterium]|nr:hypothetical protein [Gemmatimonadaceae bacterium]
HPLAEAGCCSGKQVGQRVGLHHERTVPERLLRWELGWRLRQQHLRRINLRLHLHTVGLLLETEEETPCGVSFFS